MKVLTLVEPGKVEITSLKEDFNLQRGDVLVEVDRVSLCGSDYKLFNGIYSCPSIYPIRFGHEWSGKVVDVRPEVDSIKIGDRVTGDCSCWCGNCPNCRKDKNLCQNIEKYGITKNGFSQQLKVVPGKYIYVSSPKIPYEVLALTECFAVALHAIHRLGNEIQNLPARSTLIIGCGSLGMALYFLLRCLYNWKRLEIYDVLPERISHLRNIFPGEKIGHSLDIKTTQGGNNYKTLYSQTGYTLVFEAVGKPEALQMAIDMVKPRGTIITMGLCPPGILNISRVVMKAINIIGSIGGTGEFPMVLDFFKRNITILKSLVTAKFSYNNYSGAFKAGLNQKDNIKVQILLKDNGEKDEDKKFKKN